MKVNILGPVEVWADDRPVPLPRRQQRLIVGVLALECNRWVPVQRLIDLVWGADPPAAVRGILQSRISQLRAALAGSDQRQPIIAASGVYQLRVEASEVDAHQFTALLEQARSAQTIQQRRTALRGALDLWRGPVMAGLPTPANSAGLGQSLESARLTATESLLEIELELGHHHQVADTAAQAAIEHPGRERLTGQAMLALHRSGRTAEALGVYTSAQRWLRDELGVDPGADLQRLHLELLRGNGDPVIGEAPAGPPPSGSQRFAPAVPKLLPATLVDFTGRQAYQDQIHTALTPVGDSTPVVALVGAGGIGKTTLVIHVAHGLRGVYVDGQLYADLGAFALEGPAHPLDVLRRFLQALGVDSLSIPASLTECADLYRNTLADRRVLVILDNATSDDQIAPLVPGEPTCAVLVTSRSRIGATVGATTVELDAFTAGEAAQLLTRMVGHRRVAQEPDAVTALCQLCDQLPLAVRIAGAKLAAKPHWPVTKLVGLLGDEGGRLAHLHHGRLGVAATLSLSYTSLPPPAQRLLRLIGYFGQNEVPIWAGAALADVAVPAAEQLLETLFDAQLIEVTEADSGGYPRYRCHDLIRLYANERALAEETSEELDHARSRGLGVWLFLVDEAHARLSGDRFTKASDTSVRYPLEEPVVAQVLADPLGWFTVHWSSIASLVAQPHDPTFRWELAFGSSRLFQACRLFGSWRQMLDSVLPDVAANGDRRGEAALRYQFGSLLIETVEYRAGLRELERSLALYRAVGDEHDWARVSVMMGAVEREIGHTAASAQRLHAAVEVFRAVGDASAEAWALSQLALLSLGDGDYHRADQLADQSVAAGIRSGDRLSWAQGLRTQARVRTGQGRFDEAMAALDQVAEFCRAIADTSGEATCLRELGVIYRGVGDVDRARSTLEHALQLVHQPVPTFAENQIRKVLETLPAQPDQQPITLAIDR
jgi:DNA-binding SARP family transcriptional activator/tetratricopeptide (TPR) repeat protein